MSILDRRRFVVTALALMSCSSSDGDGEAPNTSTPSVHSSSSTLSAAVMEELVFLREEEKLARDVYITLFDRWGLTVFNNISQSEQRHMDAVLAILQQYGITDPIIDDTVGVFKNPVLAQLYLDLIEVGEASEADALWVGCTIEDLDINDLDRIAGLAEQVDIDAMLHELTCGSENHMRAFHPQLLSAGETYAVQYIDQTRLDGVLGGADPTCMGGGGGM